MNRNCTLATETKTETMAAKPPPWPVSSGRRFPLLTRAEDAGFEPARAINPTRFPSVRHRPLGESSAPKVPGYDKPGRTAYQDRTARCRRLAESAPSAHRRRTTWAAAAHSCDVTHKSQEAYCCHIAYSVVCLCQN